MNVRFSPTARLPAPALLAAFLLIGVVAPATAVFWFMNEAARSQAEAARRSVMEAYRGQLALLRDRLESSWQSRTATLSGSSELPARHRAAQLRRTSGADAVIVFDSRGAPLYPDLNSKSPPDPFAGDPQWMDAISLESQPQQLAQAALQWGTIAKASKNPARSALAARNQIRCLMRLGERQRALVTIRRWFFSGAAARAADEDGRLIAADEQLLALHVMKRSDPSFLTTARGLAALVETAPQIPPSQRLFIMDEIAKLVPELPPFADRDAERLAIQYVETERPRSAAKGFQPAIAPDIWEVTSSDKSVVALYRTSTIEGLSENTLRDVKTARFQIHPPGAPAGDEAIALGVPLPGWQLSVSLGDNTAFDLAAQRRKSAYFLLGSTVIAAIAIAGLFAVHFIRRQMQLARLKTDLVAAVSHELRTPLASMSLLLENLLADETFDEQKTREYLHLMTGENERLRRLVENFLTFSRIDRQRQTFRFEPLAPGTIAESALSSMHDRFNGHAQVHFEADNALPPIRADQDALMTVLLNLLDNAWKYTNEEKRIALRVFPAGEFVAFSVTDNGIGIPAREQRKIFRRFYQVDRRLARQSSGCGLGLSIVEYLVQAHGGAVDVKSTVGAGSTFEVRIPRWHDRSAAAA